MSNYPIVSVLTDRAPFAPLDQLFFEHVGIARVDLGDPHVVVTVARDGAVLAFFYTPARDLLGLLRNDLLQPAMLRLRERSPWSYLLVDGTLRPTASGTTEVNGTSSGWQWSVVQGALLSVQEAGVGILTLESTPHLADTIYRVANRERRTQRVRMSREMLFPTPAEDILLSIPGIGDERCTALLKYAGSAGWALDLLCDPAEEIPGIPASVKHAARLALGLSDVVRLAMLGMTTEQELAFRSTQHAPDTTSDTSINESAFVAT